MRRTPPHEDMCVGRFKGCVSKKLVKAERFLSEVRVFTKGGAISMANITNQEMLSSRAKQTAVRELMRLKCDHQELLSELQPELQIAREKYRAALESFEISNLAMEKICEPGAKASAEDKADCGKGNGMWGADAEGGPEGYTGYVPESLRECAEWSGLQGNGARDDIVKGSSQEGQRDDRAGQGDGEDQAGSEEEVEERRHSACCNGEREFRRF